MAMYNVIEYEDNYLKTSESLRQCYKDETNDKLGDSESFKFKVKLILRLKYLSNFWGTLEIPLINCEINLNLAQSKDCVITNYTGEGKFEIADTQRYVPVVTLSTQDNRKLLQQLKSGFKRTTNWDKYETDPK